MISYVFAARYTQGRESTCFPNEGKPRKSWKRMSNIRHRRYSLRGAVKGLPQLSTALYLIN